MMNEKKIKLAAIELCKLKGLDPYEMIGHSIPGCDSYYYCEQYLFIAQEIRDFLHIQEAIKSQGQNSYE